MSVPKRPRPAPNTPKTATVFVLDGSVALAWFFVDEADAYADAVQDALTRARAVVPSLWPLEVANALLVGERRQRTTAEKSLQFAHLLTALPISVDERGGGAAVETVLSLAREHRLSAYDAAYLELALRRKLPLATLDKQLRQAAVAVGVATYTP